MVNVRQGRRLYWRADDLPDCMDSTQIRPNKAEDKTQGHSQSDGLRKAMAVPSKAILQ